MGHAILTATLLLLIQHGREGAALTINSNSTGKALIGQNISLDISYDVQTAKPTVSWMINGTTVAQWSNSGPDVLPSYISKLSITGKGSLLIINSMKNDTGTYAVTVNALGLSPANLAFSVIVYDPVVNATVIQSPASVNEKTAEVNLSCSAFGDVELFTWTRGGKTLGSNDTYILLDGNKTLQIKTPNRTYTGNYTCNVSNPVSSKDALWELTVSYTDSPAALSGGAIAGIVVGSVLGAILIICLVVLLVYCIRKRKKGKKIAEPQHKDVLRTVSGNTLSPDDPAYFTMNNIMYRSSSISMGSYIMNYTDDMSEYGTPSPKPPSSPGKVKHATQV
ncbi:HEPACAM family member 2-like [Mantella aurantiaca]